MKTQAEIKNTWTPWQLRENFKTLGWTLEIAVRETGYSESHIRNMLRGEVTITKEFQTKVETLSKRCES